MKRIGLLGVALLALCAPVCAAAAQPLAVSVTPAGTEGADPRVQHYARSGQPYSTLPLALRPQVLWVRIEPFDLPADAAIEFRSTSSHREIFLPSGGGNYVAVSPQESFFALPHTNKPIYARMTVTLARLPSITTLTAAQLNERQEVAWSQFFVGFFLAIGLFNLLIYAVLRDPPFLWYGGIMGAMIGIELVTTPLARPYVESLGSATSPLLRILSLSAYFIFITFFSRSFLQLRRQFPKLDVVNFIFLGANLIALCAESLLDDYWPFAWLDDFLLCALLVSLTVCGISVYRRGDTTARYYVIAFIGPAIGLIVNDAAQRLSIHTDLIIYMLQIGIAWEAIFLAVALADRTHRIAVENEKLGIAKIQAEILASQDGLTGVANRRAFDLAFENAWRTAARVEDPLAVMILDVDDFKRYNDTHGHLLGDDVLRRIARACHECTREGLDTFARYGGEEFAAVLPKAGYNEAAAVAERMRTSVLALNVLQSSGNPVTISIGMAIMDASNVATAQVLLNKADEALYLAKGQGKNCAIVSPA